MHAGRWLVVAAVAVVLVASSTAALLLVSVERREQRLQLELLAAAAANELTVELERVGDLGIGLATAADVLGPLDGASFAALHTTLDVEGRFVSALGVSYTELVDREQLPGWLAERAAEGDGFELGPDAGEPTLRVVRYILPQPANAAALGLDLHTQPYSRAAADRAVELGRPQLSPSLEVVQLPARSAAAVLHTPVPGRTTLPSPTIGIVLEWERFLGGTPELPADAEVTLVEPLAEPVVLARRGPSAGPSAGLVVQQLRYADRDLEVHVRPGPGFGPPVLARGSTLVAVGGVLVAALAGLLVTSLVSRERLASELADRRTRQLSDVNEQLARSNLALRDASRGKDEFLASVSHELRTPLTVIGGFSQSLRRAVPDREDLSVYLDPIDRNVRRLDLLVTDLLFLAGLDAGALTAVPEPVGLAALLRSAPEDLVGLTHGEVRVEVDDDLVLEADPRHLERVVTNLLANAARHGAPPIEVRAVRDGDAVEISVRDHGEGIAEDERDAVFGRFVRGGGTERASGTGLGLAIVRELTELGGGEVRYEPAGPGARFVLRLPISPLSRPTVLPAARPAPSG